MSPALGKVFVAIHEADVRLAAAECEVALVEARLRSADIAIASARRAAEEHGVPMSLGDTRSSRAAVSSPHLSQRDFAAYMGVSERTIAYDRKEMTEGVHFHAHGKRVLYHLPEAADFIRNRSRKKPLDTARLAVDEVTRRRARTALRKLKAAR
jgi:hypothetical protein